jgi:hypothetical protein
MPPAQPPARLAAHSKTATKRGMQVSGSTASQLNQEELARPQAGNFSMPSARPRPSGTKPPAR